MANRDTDGAYVRSIVAKMDDTVKDSPSKSPPRRAAPSYLGVARTNSGYNNSLLYGADHRMDKSGNVINGGDQYNGSNNHTYVSLAMLGPSEKPKSAPSKYSDLGLSLKSPEKNCRSFLRNISSFEKIAKEGQGPKTQGVDPEAVTIVGKKMQHLLHLDTDATDASLVRTAPEKDPRIVCEILPNKMGDFISAVETLLSSVEDRSVAEGLGQPDHDGNFFRRVAEVEKARLVKLCAAAALELGQNADMPDDAKGRLRAAEGKGKLLMNERFIQFDGLCEDNLNPPAGSMKVGPVDLAGFWDMVLIEVHSLYNEFRDIKDLRANNWVSVPQPEKDAKTNVSRPRSGGKKIAQKSGSPSAKSEALNKERKKKIEELRKKKGMAKNEDQVEICMPSKK